MKPEEKYIEKEGGGGEVKEKKREGESRKQEIAAPSSQKERK